MKGDLGSYPNYTLDGGIVPPRTAIIGNDVTVDKLMKALIWYHFPRARDILDPTCGIENHLMGWAWADHKRYRYFGSDVRESKYPVALIDVLYSLPFRDRSFDIIVYDPPYAPYTKFDKRDKHYLDKLYTPASIRKFYSVEVFREFHRVARMGIIVKGEDYYYPTDSNNLHLFQPLVIPNMTEAGWKIRAVYVYVHFRRDKALLQYRMRHIARRTRRPVIMHTYFVVGVKQLP